MSLNSIKMAETKAKSIKCKQEGCTASNDGKCLEGLSLNSCPHCTIVEENFIDEIIVSDVIEAATTSDKEIFHNVHLGEALELCETNCITNSSLTRLILLVGLSDAGKTTMLASIFDLFQRQSNFCGYSFAGSKTLIGFERRCHHARIKSERDIPVTERTKSSDSRVFLHLKVNNKDNVSTNLLFTDISGEIFKELNNSTIESKKFELAKRADHFALFIDSDQLSDLTNRNIAKTRSIGILRSLIETNMLGENTYIEIIFSRWDLLNCKSDVEIHTKFVDGIKEEIIKKFAKTHNNIAFFNLASRPIKLFKFGHGISEIFTDWVEKTPFTFNKKEYSSIKAENFSVREFSRYTNM
jgi:hypothetical protein